MRPISRTFLIAAMLFGGALAAPGCAADVPTASNACPCATGYVCCASGVCAPDQSGCGTATAALSIAAQGKWVGYVENAASLSSGSDDLELTLTVDEAGAITGRMIFGTGAAPPVPTDGMMTWPPGTDYAGPVSKFTARWPYEGVAYTTQSPEWEARRLRFTIARLEPWRVDARLPQMLRGAVEHRGENIQIASSASSRLA